MSFLGESFKAREKVRSKNDKRMDGNRKEKTEHFDDLSKRGRNEEEINM
jgi:hypothetical protein